MTSPDTPTSSTQPVPVGPQDRALPQDAPLVAVATPTPGPYWTRGRRLAAVAVAAGLLGGGAALGTALAHQAQDNSPATQQVGLVGDRTGVLGDGDIDNDGRGADSSHH